MNYIVNTIVQVECNRKLSSGGITLLALGTSSCKDFILSAILSLLNCPYSFVTQSKQKVDLINK